MQKKNVNRSVIEEIICREVIDQPGCWFFLSQDATDLHFCWHLFILCRVPSWYTNLYNLTGVDLKKKTFNAF